MGLGELSSSSTLSGLGTGVFLSLLVMLELAIIGVKVLRRSMLIISSIYSTYFLGFLRHWHTWKMAEVRSTPTKNEMPTIITSWGMVIIIDSSWGASFNSIFCELSSKLRMFADSEFWVVSTGCSCCMRLIGFAATSSVFWEEHGFKSSVLALQQVWQQ